MDVGELQELRANLTTDLYEEFIPFWSDSGAIDADHGGVMCEVAHDGSVKGTSKKYGLPPSTPPPLAHTAAHPILSPRSIDIPPRHTHHTYHT